MALEDYDGFDYSAATVGALLWPNGITQTQLQTPGRFSGKALSMWNSGARMDGRNRYSSVATRIVGFAYHQNATQPSNWNGQLFQWYDGTTTQMDLIMTSGFMTFRRGASTTIATAPTALTGAGWWYVEILMTIHPTAGEIWVRVENQDFYHVTGLNTQASANPTQNGIMIGQVGGNSDTTTWIDDFYVVNTSGAAPFNTFLGPVRIGRDDVTLDDTKVWTPDTGTTNFSRLTTHDGDTSYVQTGNVGDTDVYGFPAITAPGAILSTRAITVARNDNTGLRQLGIVSKKSGVVTLGSTTKYLNNVYSALAQRYDTDPATGTGWTESGLNATRMGLRLVS